MIQADEISDFEQHALLPLNLSGTTKKLSAPQNVVHYDAKEYGDDVFSKTVCQVHVHKLPINWAMPMAAAPGEALSAGTGFVVNAFGSEVVIVTNEHVVHDAAFRNDPNAITVSFPMNGPDVKIPVQLMATCPEADLAMLKVSKKYVKNTMPWFGTEVLALGTSSTHHKGEQAYVVGFPLGQRGQSMTKGVVSAWQFINNQWYIYTDAAINHGNSGGPFMVKRNDGAFEVIGVNTAIVEDAQNAGYVTPVDSLKKFFHNFQYVYAEKLKKKSKKVKLPIFVPLPVVGMKLEVMTPTLQKFKGSDVSNGLFVSFIADGSLFATHASNSKRLINEDQIIAVNGTSIDSAGQVIPKGSRLPTDLSRIISSMGFGDKINFTIIRNGAVGPMDLDLTYEMAEPRIVRPVYALDNNTLPIAIINGMVLQNLNLNLVQQLGASNPMLGKWVDVATQCSETCVILTGRTTAEAQSQLRSDGLILTKVDGKPVFTLADVANVLSGVGKEFHRFDFAPGGQNYIFQTRKIVVPAPNEAFSQLDDASIIGSVFSYVDLKTTRFDRSECVHEPGYCKCHEEAKAMTNQLQTLLEKCCSDYSKKNKKKHDDHANNTRTAAAAQAATPQRNSMNACCSDLELEELRRLLPHEVLCELGYIS